MLCCGPARPRGARLPEHPRHGRELCPGTHRQGRGLAPRRAHARGPAARAGQARRYRQDAQPGGADHARNAQARALCALRGEALLAQPRLALRRHRHRRGLGGGDDDAGGARVRDRRRRGADGDRACPVRALAAVPTASRPQAAGRDPGPAPVPGRGREGRPRAHEAPPQTAQEFAKFLPYAVALGVEKTWADRFAATLGLAR